MKGFDMKGFDMKEACIVLFPLVPVIALLLVMADISVTRIDRLKDERDRYANDTKALLSDVQHYKVQDSLHAARVQSLELSLKEFEQFRKEDARLIEELRRRNRDLAQVNTTQSETIVELRAVPKDTVVIVHDSVIIPALSLHCGDDWFDFDGILTPDEFTGTLTNRDSLLFAETLKYKRFLGFLWRTHKIKDRQLDVVSRNPHTSILNVEHIIIEQH